MGQARADHNQGACDQANRDFKYRAGCTLMIDPEAMKIRRVIRTPGRVDDDGELDRMRRYLLDRMSPPNAFAATTELFDEKFEPFALLHAHAGV